jgi:hypothetical protein
MDDRGNESTDRLCPACDLKYVPVILAAAPLKGVTRWDEEHSHPTNQAMAQLTVNAVTGRALDGVRIPGS